MSVAATAMYDAIFRKCERESTTYRPPNVVPCMSRFHCHNDVTVSASSVNMLRLKVDCRVSVLSKASSSNTEHDRIRSRISGVAKAKSNEFCMVIQVYSFEIE